MDYVGVLMFTGVSCMGSGSYLVSVGRAVCAISGGGAWRSPIQAINHHPLICCRQLSGIYQEYPPPSVTSPAISQALMDSAMNGGITQPQNSLLCAMIADYHKDLRGKVVKV